jgi:diguanylate cyclase (GGDEF)-like protein/PAS domain S-box-containing protein
MQNMDRAEGILRLMLVDDSLTDADNITNVLRSAGHTVRGARQEVLAGLELALTEASWDLVLCRDTLTAVSPRDVLNLIHRLGRDIPCIVLVTNTESMADYYHHGAQDIIMFDDAERLKFAVARELQNLFIRRSSRRNEHALRESEKRAKLLLDSSRDAVAYMHEGMHIYVNQAYLTLFGYEESEDVDGLPMLDMVALDDHAKFKAFLKQYSEQKNTKSPHLSVLCMKANGDSFPANVEFTHAEIEGEECIQVVVHDENSQEVAVSDEKLLLLRDYDVLTGLFSRIRFMDELGLTVSKASDGKGISSLLYLEFDNFQLIKEEVGLAASEEVLKEAAGLLSNILEDNELLARYSDQVFTIIIASGDNDYVDERAEAYREIIEAFVSHANGKMVELRCSIGISRITESFSIEVILENANKACMQVQKKGGNTVARYQTAKTDKGEASDDDALFWQGNIRDALTNNGFVLNYQPIVSLHGKEQELYDVLLRMKGADGQLIVAEDFIGYAVNDALMLAIDEWVITQALASLVEHRKDHPKTRFFIKLSKPMLGKKEFVDWLVALLRRHQLDGSALVFEISETAALENLEQAQAVIIKLREIGCEFGLEDFGSGLDFSYSLSVLDVDYLKINGSFVENMAQDTENQAAVKAIIEMSKQAGKQCIAEFVSDANSLALLWRLGVDYAMGFYIHKPSDTPDYNFEDDDL